MHRFFFRLLIIFLPTQLGYHLWPDWAMVLGRRVDYLSPTLFFTDILIVLTLLFWIRENPNKLSKRLVNGMLVLLGFALVNIVFSASPSVTVYSWVKVLEFGWLGYYIVKTKPSLSVITNLLSVSILYSSVIAIGQFFLQHSIGGPLWLFGERTFTIDTPGIARIGIGGKEYLRAYGTFPHPNVLGGYLATVLPFVISAYTKKQIGQLWKKIYTMTIALGIVALALTFSRSAWVVFVLGIGYWVWKKKKYPFWMPTLAVAAMIFLLAFVPLSFADESFAVRSQLNVAAMNIWQSSPLFGVGLGNFLVALPQFLPSRTIYFLQPVHNIYLLALAEVGLVGLGVLAWFIYSLCKHYRFLILPSLLSLLVLGLVDHYPLTLQQGRLLFTLFLVLSLGKKKY